MDLWAEAAPGLKGEVLLLGCTSPFRNASVLSVSLTPVRNSPYALLCVVAVHPTSYYAKKGLKYVQADADMTTVSHYSRNYASAHLHTSSHAGTHHLRVGTRPG
jgi:hypothetical protein